MPGIAGDSSGVIPTGGKSASSVDASDSASDALPVDRWLCRRCAATSGGCGVNARGGNADVSGDMEELQPSISMNELEPLSLGGKAFTSTGGGAANLDDAAKLA